MRQNPSIRWALALTVLSMAMIGLVGYASAPKLEKPGPVQHLVVCWLKNAGNIEAREHIIRASQTLAQIPGVLKVSVGGVLPSQRIIVDSSFDVALVVTLADIDVLAAYVANPLHQKMLNDVVKPLAKKVLVYDFVENYAFIQ